MKRTTYLLYITVLLGSAWLTACRKDLQRQSSTAFDVPRTPESLQALLDNDWLFGPAPAAGVLSAERFYLTDTYTDFLLPTELNLYCWKTAIFSEGETVADWNRSFEQIACSNQVLAATRQLSEGAAMPSAYNALQGQAHFLRAWSLWQLAQLYAPPYDSLQADTLPGIPLPITEEVNAKLPRASLQQTYRQILDDLLQAATQLPQAIDKAHPNRPGQAAAWGMLSRVYLGMGNYQQAVIAANNCLQRYSTLTDYNNLSTTAPLPFALNHPEVIYQSWMQDTRFLGGLVSGNYGFVEASLYNSYAPGDLRQALFFHGNSTQAQFKGSYAGTAYPFLGIAVDEILLNRAEGLAKTKQIAAALDDLDTLLSKRFAPGYYIPRKTNNADTALAWIRAEREKELVLRGLRWSDLRRLNKEGGTTTLSRTVKGITYTLGPNDRRYTLPIPPQAVKENGLSQNPR
jgi:tetratricopeptide (TPR) repeat protein